MLPGSCAQTQALLLPWVTRGGGDSRHSPAVYIRGRNHPMAHIKPILDPTTHKPVRWYAQLYLGRHPDTKKVRFVSKTFRNKKEAEAWVTNMQKDRNDGVLRPTTTKITLAEFLRDTWLPNYATQVRSIYNTSKTLGKWILTPQSDTPF